MICRDETHIGVYEKMSTEPPGISYGNTRFIYFTCLGWPEDKGKRMVQLILENNQLLTNKWFGFL